MSGSKPKLPGVRPKPPEKLFAYSLKPKPMALRLLRSLSSRTEQPTVKRRRAGKISFWNRPPLSTEGDAPPLSINTSLTLTPLLESKSTAMGWKISCNGHAIAASIASRPCLISASRMNEKFSSFPSESGSKP